MPRKSALFAIACLLANSSTVTPVNASQVLIFKFDDIGTPAFIFGGGLLGIASQSELDGEFEIEQLDDDSLVITRFDVTPRNVVDSGAAPWASSDLPLPDQLYVSPVGLVGQLLDDGSVRFDSRFSGGDGDRDLLQQIPPLDEAWTGITLGSLAGQSSTVWIASRLGSGVLDAPSYRTDIGGLAVTAIPEPGTAAMAVLGSAIAIGISRFHLAAVACN